MEKEKYLEMRNGLYNEAENLINEGKIDEGNAKMQEIKDLDTKFENEATAMANLNALNKVPTVTNMQKMSKQVEKGSVIDSTSNSTYTECSSGAFGLISILLISLLTSQILSSDTFSS